MLKNKGRWSDPPALSFAKRRDRLDGLEVRRLGAARIRHDVERDLLAFAQGAHAGSFNGRGVHEHVLAAAFRRDEAKAFGGVEELDGSDSHKRVSCIDFRPGGMPGWNEALRCCREGSSTVVQARTLRAGRISLG